MGRKSKLTEERQERILQAIRAGNYIETAALHAGISEGTFHRWMQEGERAKTGKKREFYEAVKKARADAETRTVAIISNAMPTSWQAAAWWLERSFPDRWGRNVHEHRGKDGGPVQHEVNIVAEEAAKQPEVQERIREGFRERVRDGSGEE